MSKNPAWNAYNETVRTVNEEYEKEIKPLRVTLSKEIAQTEKRFDDKIDPLVAEKKSIIKKLQDDYSDKVVATEKIRRDAVKRAHNVLDAELRAQKETPKEASAA